MNMDKPAYKIESSHRIIATLPRSPVYNGELLADRDLAVSLAAKCMTDPPGGLVRVIGEIVYSKTSEWGTPG
jgi:hypothetical protein